MMLNGPYKQTFSDRNRRFQTFSHKNRRFQTTTKTDVFTAKFWKENTFPRTQDLRFKIY